METVFHFYKFYSFSKIKNRKSQILCRISTNTFQTAVSGRFSFVLFFNRILNQVLPFFYKGFDGNWLQNFNTGKRVDTRYLKISSLDLKTLWLNAVRSKLKKLVFLNFDFFLQSFRNSYIYAKMCWKENLE